MARARRLACLAPLTLALLAPAAAQAAPTLKVRSVASPPQVVAPGGSFSIASRVENSTRKSQRVRVRVTLRTTKYGKVRYTASAARKTLKARKSARYSVRVKLPSTLKEGRYYVRACADTGKVSGAACRFTTKRVTVRKAAPAPAPAPTAPPAAAPLPAPGPTTAPEFKVLAFTKGGTATAETAKALRDLGDTNRFAVTVTDDASVFTQASLGEYKTVIFVNNKGDILTDAQQAAFEAYYQQGGGFLAIGAAIEAEPTWAFYEQLLGTRAASTNPVATNQPATIKVADRVHDASKSLPEYWKRTDAYYNFRDNVRGQSHVLATVDETTYTGGTMKTLADHPVAWCKDYKSGRSFYTGVGANGNLADDKIGAHLVGAIQWTSGLSDPVYSDCGATVLKNFKQVKVSGPPNLNEPIGFDQFPDGRIIQTARNGDVRLHDGKGNTILLGKLPVYTNSEDGLYGPAVDRNFAQNKWVYLYYAPPTVNIRKCDGTMADVTTPAGSAPNVSADPCVWQDQWGGYFQLSRFKFVDQQGDTQPRLDLQSEQKILQVPANRGACCHVAGDIDFDKDNNLWLTTGDDTPAGSGNAGGFGNFNDSKTEEWQGIRVTGATGGTFQLTWDGQTTEPIPYNATASAIETALMALSNVASGDMTVTGNNNVSTTKLTLAFGGANSGKNVPNIGVVSTGLTGTNPAVAITVDQEAGLYNAPHVDARRSSLNTNDLRGKLLRIKVKEGDIAPPEGNVRGAAYTTPPGNLFPEGDPQARPEVYAMGFRNPFRVQVDDNGVAYLTDYSSDSQTPENYRGPAGTGRVEIVRKPGNYGWPLCNSAQLPFYEWNFNLSRPLNMSDPKQFECDNPNRGPANLSRWNTGRTFTPPITSPDIWYSFRDNNASGPLGTPCLAYYDGSGGKCPQLFPELYQGGVAPHGAAPYRYDKTNPSTTKFPPYYDGSFILGEFGQDQLREVRVDSQNKIFKINQTLNCGPALQANSDLFECDNPMDMQFGADGNLYLLTYGDGFFAANADAGMYRWYYRKGAEPPTAMIAADVTSGRAPLTVKFSSAGSRVGAEQSIRYAWDFDGNGTVDSIDANPSFVYATNGVYTAKLTVTDSAGQSDTQSTPITIGNTAPTITLTAPTQGDFFEWGQKVPYTVTVTDPEDGAVDCARVRVSFVLIHDTHGHGEEDKTGCSGTLQTLAEDASHGGWLAGGIVATYTDNGANGQPSLTGRAEKVVQLKRQEPEFSLSVSGTTTATPPAPEDNGTGAAISSLDPGDWVSLNREYNLQNMEKSITFRYAGGSGGNVAGRPRMNVEIREGSATGNILTTVTLNSTGTNNNTYTNQTFPLNYTGSKQLFLVFRSVTGETGAPTANMGLINWVGFTGPGIGTP